MNCKLARCTSTETGWLRHTHTKTYGLIYINGLRVLLKCLLESWSYSTVLQWRHKDFLPNNEERENAISREELQTECCSCKQTLPQNFKNISVIKQFQLFQVYWCKSLSETVLCWLMPHTILYHPIQDRLRHVSNQHHVRLISKQLNSLLG